MKRIYTPEQKERNKISKAEWRANRSSEKVAEDKAKANLYQANLTLEQKEQRKIKFNLKQANRSLEEVEKDKAKAKIAAAKSLANRSPEKVAEDKAKRKIINANRGPSDPNVKRKKYIYTEEQKEQRKITLALKKANFSTEQLAEDKAKRKISTAKCRANRTPEQKAEDYAKRKIRIAATDLGCYAVYLIENYNSSGDHYCGQTGNLHTRMQAHKTSGRLNTDAYRVLQYFETREQALAFEAIQHEAGYHGYNNGQ